MTLTPAGDLATALVVVLDNECFFAHEKISGTVIVLIDSSIFIDTTTVKLESFTDVHWKQVSKGSTTVPRQASKNNISARQVILSQHMESGGLTEVLDAGDGTPQTNLYLIPFCFSLPTDAAPPSFEGRYGCTQYRICAVVTSGFYTSQRAVKHFTFLGPKTWVSPMAYQTPVFFEKKKTFLFFGKGSVRMFGKVKKTHFCCGERLPVTVAVTNDTPRDVILSITLHQKVLYHAGKKKSDQKMENSVIKKCCGKPLIPYAIMTFDTEEMNFRVPPLPPTSSNTNALISISYDILIELNNDNGDSLQTQTIPITILNWRPDLDSVLRPEIIEPSEKYSSFHSGNSGTCLGTAYHERHFEFNINRKEYYPQYLTIPDSKLPFIKRKSSVKFKDDNEEIANEIINRITAL